MGAGEITIVYISIEREIAAITTVAETLERLDYPARRRVLRWASDRYGVNGPDGWPLP